MEELRRAVAAGRATAAELGLQADEVVVVHDSDRLVLRLVPCDVLVRVAPEAHRANSEFEVEVAQRAAAVGAPVGTLDPRVAPRVHARDGFAISFWTYYPPTGSTIAPERYAESLVRYHAALRQADLAAPHFTDRVAIALREVSDRERTPGLADADRELLRDTLGTAVNDSGDQLLHGEPHAGNVLDTARGPLFVDLATCCRGPVEFDLAHAPEDVAAHYPGADRDLVRRYRTVMWAMFTTWRWRNDDRFPDRDRRRVEGLDLVRAAHSPGPLT